MDFSELQEGPDDQREFEQRMLDEAAINKQTKSASTQRKTGPGIFGKRAPSRKPRGRAAAKVKRDIKDKIKAWLMLSNTLLELHPALAKDALDEFEIDKAAEALNTLAQKNDMLYGALTTVVGGSGMYESLLILGIIGGRRLARHDIIPSQFDDIGGALLDLDGDTLKNMMGFDDENDTQSSSEAG